MRSSPPSKTGLAMAYRPIPAPGRAARVEDTDWLAICALYDALLEALPSPVVELNRAVAVSRAHGAAAALPLVQALAAQPQLAQYHLLPSVMADLLSRLGRHDEARVMWQRAADLTRNARERELLLARVHPTPPEGGKA
jgi:predicted RNA polymerase sigma factor